MVTRSIVGRFLILAVLLVSLGVIAQAALIISRGPGRSVAKADTPRAAVAVASLAASPANAATPVAATPVQGGETAQTAEAAPVRVVYPGPLGDAPVQPRKITDAAPASPLTAPAVTPVQTAAVVAAPPAPSSAVPQPAGLAPAPPADPVPPAAAAVPPPAAPVVVASADNDTQPAAETGAGHGVNLNSASIDALNHIGGGHIGQTIVRHRPYHSVEDLVRKRVVRRSVYEQIKNQVAAE